MTWIKTIFCSISYWCYNFIKSVRLFLKNRTNYYHQEYLSALECQTASSKEISLHLHNSWYNWKLHGLNKSPLSLRNWGFNGEEIHCLFVHRFTVYTITEQNSTPWHCLIWIQNPSPVTLTWPLSHSGRCVQLGQHKKPVNLYLQSVPWNEYAWPCMLNRTEAISPSLTIIQTAAIRLHKNPSKFIIDWHCNNSMAGLLI